jgi:hypothetical protein
MYIVKDCADRRHLQTKYGTRRLLPDEPLIQRLAALFGDAESDRKLWEKSSSVPLAQSMLMLSSRSRSPQEKFRGDNPGICLLEGDLACWDR